MIKTVGFKNFKGIREAEVALEQLTVVVGPNASGKTTLLEGVHCVSQIQFDNKVAPQSIFKDSTAFQRIRRADSLKETIELNFSNDQFAKYRLQIIPQVPQIKFNLLNEYFQNNSVNYKVVQEELVDDGGRQIWKAPNAQPSASQTNIIQNLLRLDPSVMTGLSKNESTNIDLNGKGLASVLVNMALAQQEDFQILQNRMKSVLPSFSKIRFVRVVADIIEKKSSGIDGIIDRVVQYGHKIFIDYIGSMNVSVELASEGTILILGLLTALMRQERPNVLLLDDLDRGLHPRAQRELVGLLRIILEQNPDLQIVATTHSPYLVDQLRPEEVRLTTLNDDGTVSIAGLMDHPDFDKWKDEMAPGEMWSLFGEDWVGKLPKNAGAD